MSSAPRTSNEGMAASRDPRAWLLLAIPLLLPFGAAAELPVLVAALFGAGATSDDSRKIRLSPLPT